ncbi:winged helix-turn-helix domain-containing protein [Rhizobium leguminosarum]|uniref:winged helix-turn-helix domain-containing protein n=1 Tax=Rhizobium leguminosarum TaxID=384 RepID=UPI003F9E3239
MNTVFKFGPFSLHPVSRTLVRDGRELVIGSRAFDMLVALVHKQGEVISRRELMACAWSGLSVEDSNVRVQMAHLRRELGCGVNGDRYIASVAGRGYCFVMPVETREAELSSHIEPSVSDPTSGDMSPGDTPMMEEKYKAGSIPLRSETILGRSSDLEELSVAVEERRLVTVVGPGGVGKTTLARVLARHVRTFDQTKFVDLSVITDDALVAGAVASVISPHTRSGDPLRDAVTWLAKKRSLLILDNCEHVIDGVVGALSFILAQSPTTHVLATSIEALRVSGEAVYLLRPLGTPPNTGRMTASHALAWPSVELFMQRASDGGHKAKLADEEAAVVAAICRRLDGNPLAIELVASRVGIYGLDGVLNLLDNQLTFRWRGDRDAAPRHQTVQSLLDWSYALLSAKTQTVLNRLSVFGGEFDMDAAMEVIADSEISHADVAMAIGDLVDKSLVALADLDEMSRALKLREIVRTYATSKMTSADERFETQRRHALFYLRRMRAWDSTPTNSSVALREPHLGNVRTALQWAFSDNGDNEIGAEICALLLEVFSDTLQLDEYGQWYKRALASLPSELRNTDLHLKLWECLATAWLFGGVSDQDVETAFKEGLELSLNLEQHRRHANLLAGLCMYHLKKGDFRSGREIAYSYRDKANAEGGPDERVIAGWMLGTMHHMVGEQVEAAEAFDYSFSRAAGRYPSNLCYFERTHLLLAKIIQARVTWLRGSPEIALQMAENSIDEVRDHVSSLRASLTIGIPIFLLSGELERAEILINQLAELTTGTATPEYSEACIAMRGELLLLQGDAQQSVEILRGKLTSVGSIRLPCMINGNLRALAEALSMVGEHAEAISAIDTALALSERAGGSYFLPELMRTKAMILLSSPQPDFTAVQRLLDEGTAIARRTSAIGWELRLYLAQLTADQMFGRRLTNGSRTKLGEIVQSFQGCFETADLRTAKSYLRGEPDTALAS